MDTEPVDIIDAIFSRRTTNTAFRDEPVSLEHQHLLLRAAGAAPSHFNSQPWRFILIEAREIIEKIAALSGSSMQNLLEEGRFFERYLRYFRFSEEEMESARDGIFIDQLPTPLRPFIKPVMSGRGSRLLSKLGVARLLAEENRKLVAGSPLLLAVLLDKREYRPQALSGFYSVFSMGAAMENIWLLVGKLNMGIQFVSTPMEVPEAWQEITTVLNVPDSLELMAIYRLGYLPGGSKRPAIDWSSRQRKRISQFACRDRWGNPEAEPQEDGPHR